MRSYCRRIVSMGTMRERVLAVVGPHTQLFFSSLCRCHSALASSGRDFVSGEEGFFGDSLRCNSTADSYTENVPPDAGNHPPSRKTTVEKLWLEFFSDPSQWYDIRADKVRPSFPDFKHQKTHQGLWLTDKSKPAWVDAELAAVPQTALRVNIFPLNNKLKGYAKARNYRGALELFRRMLGGGAKPNEFTFIPVLQSCSGLRDLEYGRHIHVQIIEAGHDSNVFVAGSLVDMYAKCGSMEDAWIVFSKMPAKNVVVWSVMITGYVRCGQGQKALELYRQMHREGVNPDPFTLVAALNACSSVGAIDEGRHIHEQIIQSGYASHIFLGNSLIDMYAKCGSIGDAERVFKKMPRRDLVSWNSMIGGYVKCGEGLEALELSRQMQQEGMDPNPVTFVALLDACASIGALAEGRHKHEQIVERGYECDIFVGSSLINMYAKCGSIKDAERVFYEMPRRNVVSWSAMIGGYVKCEEGEKAFELCKQMQLKKVDPNPVAYVTMLNACASVGGLDEGRRLHEQIILKGHESNIFVGNSLVDMYAKCGSMKDATGVFDMLPTKYVVSWNALIEMYVKYGEGQRALELYRLMQLERVEPNLFTFAAVLNACASLGALEKGRYVHEEIIARRYEPNIFVGLIHMYAKCGSIEDSERVFNLMPAKNILSWNAIIAGYAIHGYARKSIEKFEKLCEEVGEVNSVTFISLLSGCSYDGLVDEGLHYFECMSSVYSISPSVEHFSRVVYLLGRTGRLHEAEDLIGRMPFEPSATVWKSLLDGCKIHGNVDMAEYVAKQVVKLDPKDAAGYLILSSIYASVGKWDSHSMVQQQRCERGVKKLAGCTSIEVNKEMHSFVVDDHQHPQIEEIHQKLDILSEQMKASGYEPDARFVFHDMDGEGEDRLCRHSEKLAVAFGLISTPPGLPLLVMKNLHVCLDCHTAAKFVSMIDDRAITIRDMNRFHHFEDGLCSCRDYW